MEPASSLREVYETGRGGVRTRARWYKEEESRGVYRIVVTEIPYQVKKADLVEQLAELIEAKRAPLLGDVRDESAEDVRLVLEPKSRNVEPEVLMESLFKLSDLETRFPVNLNVLDARGTEVPIGVVGELCIGGEGVARGYLGRPELTAGRFIDGGTLGRLYRTGDLGRWRNDGTLECLGRNDFQLKIRGYRIEAGEVEHVLLAHPAVARAVVVGRPAPGGETRLLAYVVPHPGADIEEETLRAHVAQRLPSYMVPQRCLALPTLPDADAMHDRKL